jgi:heparin/heparan-sulfate lyase
MGVMAGLAGPAAAVHPEHPRLFFRRQSWGERGLTLAEVRRRGAAFADSLTGEAIRSPEGAPNLALHCLVTGSEDSARAAVRLMKRGYSPGEWTTTQGDEIEATAIAYDWLAGAWEGFPAEDRTEIQDLLVRSGNACVRALATGASIYHTRMYAWANGALFAGLALHGDRPEAAALTDFGIRYYRDRLMPARAHTAGAWFNALSYGKKYMCRSVFSFLAAWRSATGEDLWAAAKASGNNWPETMLLYLLYMLRPDFRFATYGDIFDSMWTSAQGTRRVVAQAVSETRNPYGQGFLREIEEHDGRKAYDRESRWYQIFEDPSIPARPRSELPPVRLFSPESVRVVVMRSGWGPDDTWALFKCGDYGDNHGHFDQGHFEIFRRGQLALDSFYGAKETIYHNTILVKDPEDPNDKGNQRLFSRQIHASLASYLADPAVRTGTILDFRERDGTTAILGDATPAYPPARVKSFTRQVVFLDRRLFIVFDVVTVPEARFERIFQLHYPSAPRVEGRSLRWVSNGGQLIVRTLLPEKPSRSMITLGERDRPVPFKNFQPWYPAGRLDVEPSSYDSPTTIFLHVLAPGDEGDPAPELELRGEGSGYVLRAGARRLRFEKSGRKLCEIQ